VTWLRRGDGLVGWGRAAELRTTGATRFADAVKWWSETTAYAVVRDEVGEPGSGLVAFGTFAFADEPGESTLVVPEVVVGRRAGVTWLTTVSRGGLDLLDRLDRLIAVADPPAAPREVVFGDGALNGEQWMSVVADAVSRIDAGDLEKVVLARDLVVTSADPIDVRWPLSRLAEDYPMCWTFHVDGMFGATPELLVRRERGLVTSRVLAGTIRRTGDDERDLALAATLARSSKDLEEHEYAVRSVADALDPHCSSMNVPEAPFVLHLPNVMHLATDVAGVVHDAETVSSLQLAEALHPSAAVGGTPTSVAVELIAQLEGMDRGRYAGPVGWMDAAGDGEWGIALRSAVVDGGTVRLFAGCGIVADSDPEAELAEAQAKFVPVRDALSG
jgi:menaquinone-specific isochorismate synthase